MNMVLSKYLTEVYRRDVLGEPIVVATPAYSPELVAAAKAEVARIDGLRLGPHLANRDFVSYQNRRAIEVLLKQLQPGPGNAA